MNFEEEIRKMEKVLRTGKRFPLMVISRDALLVRDEEGRYVFLTRSDKDAAIVANPVSQKDAEAIMFAGVQIALDGGVVRRPLRECMAVN
ncbi:MAG: hypothetical protein ABSE82_12320 [Nitrososphaerales archaeon]|jgi:hypothetical protein